MIEILDKTILDGWNNALRVQKHRIINSIFGYMIPIDERNKPYRLKLDLTQSFYALRAINID
jgi:hypothetical protein